MAMTVTMPQMGESVVEGTVERWLVAEGERVAKDQVLCEITTEKVDAEVVAPEAGVVVKLLVPQGTTVAVGTEPRAVVLSSKPWPARTTAQPSVWP